MAVLASSIQRPIHEVEINDRPRSPSVASSFRFEPFNLDEIVAHVAGHVRTPDVALCCSLLKKDWRMFGG